MKHPFFEAISMCSQIEKKTGSWGAGSGSKKKRQFINALKKAHPFVFDRRVTMEKRMEGRAFREFENLVEDFSMPYSTSIYLLTDAPTMIAPTSETDPTRIQFQILGYLIDEIDPENFSVYEVSWVDGHGVKKVPSIAYYEIHLKTIGTAFDHARALGMSLFERKTEAHSMKEISSIISFTKAISVKRIGVEVPRPFSVKTRGIGVGSTMLRFENLIHIADKEEYEYSKSIDGGEVNWDWRGFWRGHWRALYFGDDIKDAFGRRVVDYQRLGKNRLGEYNVPGYTWVVEHTKGDPRLAEIKTHTVKKG